MSDDMVELEVVLEGLGKCRSVGEGEAFLTRQAKVFRAVHEMRRRTEDDQ